MRKSDASEVDSMTMSETEWVACVMKSTTVRTKLKAEKVVMIRMSEEPATGYAPTKAVFWATSGAKVELSQPKEEEGE